MTRGEALRYNQTFSFQEMDNVINEIFNDFESRTCENCKWFDKFDEYKGLCQKIGPVHEVSKNFGCNKWESNKPI